MEFYLKLDVQSDNGSNDLIKFEIENYSSNDEFNLINEIYKTIEKELGISKSEFCLESSKGKKITSKTVINNKETLKLCPLLLGGKGGFGSLLRAFGKQITKSTNKEACRDLTGRRIRHVNNEKKLKEFLEKQSERAKQKEEQKKEKAEKRKKKRERLESSHHLFVDPKYDEQKQKIAQDLDEAIKIAAGKGCLSSKKKQSNQNDGNEKNSDEPSNDSNSNTNSNDSVTNKNQAKNTEQIVVEKKTEPLVQEKKVKEKDVTNKFKDWMGVGDLEVTSSDDEEEEEEAPKKKQKV